LLWYCSRLTRLCLSNYPNYDYLAVAVNNFLAIFLAVPGWLAGIYYAKSSTALKTSPAFNRVFKRWPARASFASRKTLPVAASVVME